MIHIKPLEDNFDLAIQMLQEYSLPEQIPCRDYEKKQIQEFIDQGLQNNGQTNCLYISGVPGIGKTASFLEVIRNIQKKEEFLFIHINAMNLSNPEHVYQLILQHIIGEYIGQLNITQTSSFSILNEVLTKGKFPQKYKQLNQYINHKNIVILLDELDFLVTQDQEVLYNLMEWPHHKQSKLTIIGIANTMNLPETLQNKIKSRMGALRLIFNQYTQSQIQKIIKYRLENVKNVFEDSAIQFATTKIAQSSTDLRKLLKILRKSIEICLKENQQKKLTFLFKFNIQIKLINYNIILFKRKYFNLFPFNLRLSLSLLLQKIKKEILISVIYPRFLFLFIFIFINFVNQIYERYLFMLNNLGEQKQLSLSQVNSVLNQLASLKILQIKEKLWTQKEIINCNLDPNKFQISNFVDKCITSQFEVDNVTNYLRDDDVYKNFQFQF
ncbi:origin recognition complex 1 protein, putative [Ichthyophthirius multifiliis]|uniref:Origin recognition complex subunit 1 n=1 Tax=Ichthyophthirius multifiliis TaxID=5932 RepID=G0QIU4_ICHMU|nr:origin recognition complex 1 protein, putative [Ichthyophthirius multifiliis]EGR34830.1 origin recognition complex 1 protein, putative [Ichthyophthirius multifiliis]|eukprot:XP_004040134.1 origin recognition complex 1 protein, putative [Ichthyophthirius multifiliis]